MMVARVRILLRTLIGLCLIQGLGFFIKPEWYSSGAYQWADDKVGLRTLAVAWLIVAVWLAVVLRVQDARRAGLWWALGLYMWAQVTMAWSIFQLTWNGSQGAILGSVQWLSMPVIVIQILRAQIKGGYV